MKFRTARTVSALCLSVLLSGCIATGGSWAPEFGASYGQAERLGVEWNPDRLVNNDADQWQVWMGFRYVPPVRISDQTLRDFIRNALFILTQPDEECERER